MKSRAAVGQIRFDSSFDSVERGDLPLDVKHDFRSRPIPLPLPAVSFNHTCEEGTWDGDNDASISRKAQDEGLPAGDRLTSSLSRDAASTTSGSDPMSFVGGRPPPTTTTPYPPPSNNGNPLPPSRRASGGGGGGGRHRCPKCGTYTIFSHNEFGNSFYCATCSGWFTAETMEGDESLMKVRRESILLCDIRDSYGIFGA